jgi:hypothetical protein
MKQLPSPAEKRESKRNPALVSKSAMGAQPEQPEASFG